MLLDGLYEGVLNAVVTRPWPKNSVCLISLEGKDSTPVIVSRSVSRQVLLQRLRKL